MGAPGTCSRGPHCFFLKGELLESSAVGSSAGRLILANARVHTLLPSNLTVEAVGIGEGRIRAVGALSDVRAAVGPAREVDLVGSTVVPGLVDAHGHLAMMGERMRQLDLSAARSPEEVAALVAARVAGAAAGEWLVGRAWDQNRFENGGLPDRACLDRAAPDHPVFLERVDGHAAWTNSRALEAAGLGRDSPDPPGGRILRDSAGEPTGILVDAAMKPVVDRLPAPTDEELEARLLTATERCAGFGLTAVHDAGVDLRSWTVLERLARQGRLPVRVRAMAWRGAASFEELIGPGPRTGLFGGMLSLRAVKFLVDGALGSRGAALFEDYCDEPGQTGLLVELGLLERDAARLLRRGFQLAVHAIGDRAAALALAVLERAAREAGVREPRSRLEHAQLLRDEDFGRLARAGVIASVQPVHQVADMSWVERRLGPERLARAYAWRSLLEAGTCLAFGTDFPIEEPNPLRTLHAAITRQDAHRRPAGGWRPEQRLTAAEALDACTRGAAFAAFEEGQLGRVAPGMRADLTALDVDPLACDPWRLLEGRAMLTMVGGRIVFER